MAELADLERALVNADAAGDTNAARMLATEIARMRGSNTQALIEQARADDEAFRATVTPTNGMSALEKGFAGAGKFVADSARGVGQMMGLVDEQDVAEARKRDAPLMETTAGKVGNIAGGIAAFVPTALIPGANTITGGALSGAAFGAMQPTVEGESRGMNTAISGALGAGGQAIGNQLARVLSNRAATQQAARVANQPADDILRESVEAGYNVPPSYARGGVLSRLAEGLSGKYKTGQLAGIRNQSVTNRLAREAVGLPDNVPLTAESMKQLRQTAFNQGYTPVRNAGTVATDAQFAQSLDDAVRSFRDVAADFPELVDDQIIRTVDSLKKPSFDAKSGLSAIRLLRDKASAFYRAGENSQGAAARGAADAIEDQIERHLSTMGQPGNDMLEGFRNARQLIAKSHTVEEVLTEAGNVDAVKLAAALRRGAPLSGELKTAARFGDAFRDVARVPASGDANPLTALDFAAGNITGGVGMLAGGPAAGVAMGVGLPAARVASRYSVLSGPVQRAMASKSYDPSMLAKALMSRPATKAMSSLPPAVLAEIQNQ